MEWKIHDPNWNRKKGRWFGIYGSNYYMSGEKSVDRVMLDYPETAEHFYYLHSTGCMNTDIIFASYSAEEIRKFVQQMSWTERNKVRNLYVRDVPNKDIIEGKRFVEMFMREGEETNV